MGEGIIHVGTSAFTAAGCPGSFYPANLKPADYLSFYATQFDSVEIDSTFYRTAGASYSGPVIVLDNIPHKPHAVCFSLFHVFPRRHGDSKRRGGKPVSARIKIISLRRENCRTFPNSAHPAAGRSTDVRSAKWFWERAGGVYDAASGCQNGNPG